MSSKIITTAISAILSLGVTHNTALADQTSQTMQQDMTQMMNVPDMEKCYGIAKAGQNDCGTASHACASESRIDGDKEAWILVPNGLCQKIAGGSTKATTDKA
jgi:uncharacterized membrane protein